MMDCLRDIYRGALVAAGGCVLAAGTFQAASAAPLVAAALRPALITPLAQHAVLEAVCRTGSRLVAVGERGIVLLSDDEGRHWRQAPSPVSVTLTACDFVDAGHGWAVGHAGVVLSSDDGGEHWVKQLDGARAARLALIEASRAAAQTGAQDKPVARTTGDVFAGAGSTAKTILANAKRLLDEGADKPFLSIDFSDRQHGTAVGAYGLAVHTDDGGQTWQSWVARIGDPHGLHLYAVKQRGTSIWVAGEQGFVAHSNDNGATFATVRTPYAGSFFALDVDRDQTVMLGGLKGHLYRLSNGDAAFAAVALDSLATITDVRVSDAGTWFIANQAGDVFVSRDHALTFRRWGTNPRFPLNNIVQTADDTVVGVGFGGAEILGTVNDTAATIQPQATSVSGAKP